HVPVPLNLLCNRSPSLQFSPFHNAISTAPYTHTHTHTHTHTPHTHKHTHTHTHTHTQGYYLSKYLVFKCKHLAIGNEAWFCVGHTIWLTQGVSVRSE